MKYKTFKDFLISKFAEENPQVLDDDMPDAFDEWLYYEHESYISRENIVKYADEYAAIQKREIVEEEVKLEDLVKLYISLNFDYTRLSINNISFASTIAIEQERRLDMVWKRLANVLEDKPSQPTPN